MESEFYGGRAAGIANIDFSVPETTIFNFAATTTNTMLQPFVKDYFGVTNRLEGILNAELVVTHANTADTNDMQGYGKASLREGFLGIAHPRSPHPRRQRHLPRSRKQPRQFRHLHLPHRERGP